MALNGLTRLVQDTSEIQHWALSPAQQAHYVAWMTAHQPDDPQQQLTVLCNYHHDHSIVDALLNEGHALHQACWDDVTRIISRLCMGKITRLDPAIDHSDIIQTALEHITQGLPGFRHNSRLSTWIHKIGLNTIRHYQRYIDAECRRGGAEVLDDHPELSAPNDQVHEHLAKIMVWNEIRTTLLNHGTRRLATIFQLRAVDDLCFSAIGDQVKLSPGRVHTLFNVVCRLLQKNPALQQEAIMLGIKVSSKEQVTKKSRRQRI